MSMRDDDGKPLQAAYPPLPELAIVADESPSTVKLEAPARLVFCPMSSVNYVN